MAIESINPTTGQTVKAFDSWDKNSLEAALARAQAANPAWQACSFEERATLMTGASRCLRDKKSHYAHLITLEMGKPVREAEAEIEKCALVCEYYAEHAQSMLADRLIESDASKSYVAHLPLGTVLAVMPWNFPFWQVFRFAAPGLMAGNTAVLKHASNVPQCAEAIEEIFCDAGFPAGVFQTLMITASQVASVIEDPRVMAVTLTGSEDAGRKVAATAGVNLKKSLLELGGSDPFIVLEDADLDLAARIGTTARFLNNGQSCIAAKRFIVVETIAEEFLNRFRQEIEKLKMGDPADATTDLGPMARHDLRDALHTQVTDSLAAGAVAALGCTPVAGEGAYYAPSILDHVRPGMRAYEEELFGPVAIVIRASDETDALRIANDTRFGLGASIWTQDISRGERLARLIESGASFINGMVKSDPRLPFGGTKASGYGRELSDLGILEFVNAKTIWVGEG